MEHISLADAVKAHLGIDKASFVDGGPSASDPMGEICKYMGLIGTDGSTFYIGVSENGRIVKCGGTVSGRKFEVQIPEKV